MAKEEICIIGVGRFGRSLIESLSVNINYRVIAVDSSEDRLASIDKYVDWAVVGDATNTDFYKDNGLDKIDNFVIGIGSDIQSSLLIASILKGFGKENIYAKAVSESHEKILKSLNITKIINPEQDAARKLAYDFNNPLYKMSNASSSEDISSVELDGNYNWTRVRVSGRSPVSNTRIMDIPSLRNAKIVVALINRSGKYLVPKGQDIIFKDDYVFIIGKGKSLSKFVKVLRP
ncbi:MAG: TrkA family potassium uptake protein [Mycoplasmataceae bacterium]|nr:TrkA family potassium uptake protein [Mycoplasmataceae bacterium]